MQKQGTTTLSATAQRRRFNWRQMSRQQADLAKRIMQFFAANRNRGWTVCQIIERWFGGAVYSRTFLQFRWIMNLLVERGHLTEDDGTYYLKQQRDQR